MSVFASLLGEWLAIVPRERILRLDVTDEPTDYGGCIPDILERIAILNL